MKTVLLFGLLMLRLTAALAQTAPVDTTNGKPYYILLNDGSHVVGRIVRADSAMYTVRTRGGQLTYVERALFRAISNTAPAPTDSTVYYAPTSRTGPGSPTSSGQYVITLQDGTLLRGRVLSQDTSQVVVETNNLGTVRIPAGQVLRMERANAGSARLRGNRFPAEGYRNLFPQYLNLTPTAFQAERGRVYYRNTSLAVNQIDVGITDNWSVGAGLAIPFPIPFVVAGWLATKVSVPLSPGVRVGVQGQYYLGAFTLFSTEAFQASYVQGLLSLGSSQNNVTFGLGKSLDGQATGSVLTVGIVRKVGPLLTFISENSLILTRSNNLPSKLSAGVRIDRQRHSFDLSGNLFLGLFNGPAGGVGFTPLVSYQLRLGQ